MELNQNYRYYLKVEVENFKILKWLLSHKRLLLNFTDNWRILIGFFGGVGTRRAGRQNELQLNQYSPRQKLNWTPTTSGSTGQTTYYTILTWHANLYGMHSLGDYK